MVSEVNYAAIDKDIKAILNALDTHEIFLTNWRFLLITDTTAMKKVLTKQLNKINEEKFSRWHALFSNIDFDIEHINVIENSIPNSLIREHLQNPSKRTSEWEDLKSSKHEHLKSNKQEIAKSKEHVLGKKDSGECDQWPRRSQANS